jgi:peptidoglycan/LPS O-acetylase OafA/YrhL
MEQNTTSSRLHALDGIRGIAILLVVLNHINTTYISPLLPPQINQMLFGSGVTGVSLLFILSGFLMAYIYPNPASPLRFLQKRYTRIFPLFLTMSFSVLLFRVFPNLSWFIQIFFILFAALISHLIWVYGIKKYASLSIKRKIFLAFLFLQILTGAFYLWIMRHPPIVFQQMPQLLRDGTIGLVNATLTLPLGDYIPMLDGVYWSLASEVLFYILYPIICVPIIRFLIPYKRWIKILILLTLIPFFISLDILSHKIFLLSMLQLPLCFYFLTGIVLGHLYRGHPNWINNTNKLFPNFLKNMSIALFAVIVFLKLFALNAVDKSLYSLIHILWAFPLTFLLAIALDQKTALAKILNTRALIFLGTISYSIYLSHAPIIHMAENAYKVTNLATNIIAACIVFITIMLMATLLYQLLEKPYFKRNKEKEKKEYAPQRVNNVFAKPAFIFIAIFLLFFLAVFNAYQSQANFFSMEYSYPNTIFILPKVTEGQKEIAMSQYPKIQLQIKAIQNNFEIVSLRIAHKSGNEENSRARQLLFRIREVNQKNWYATNTYDVKKINDSSQFPFGFPVISNAKGKTYLIELTLSKPPADYIAIDTTKNSLLGIYKIDKYHLISQPGQLLAFIYTKIQNVKDNQEAQVAILLSLPLAITILSLCKLRRL